MWWLRRVGSRRPRIGFWPTVSWARCHARAQLDPLGMVLLRVRNGSRSGDVRSFSSTHFAQDRDEHGWDRDAARPGLGFAGFVEGDVGFSDLEPSPPVGGQYGGADAEHDDFRWA